MANPSLQRLVLVTETYRPEVNGVSTTLANWVEGLRRDGISVTVIRPRQNHEDEPVSTTNADSEILVKGFPIPGYSELRFGVTRKKWMIQKIRKARPDAVYIATEGPLGLMALRAAKTLGLRTITGFHTNFQSYSRFYSLGWLEPLILKYLRWFHNASQGTIVPTQQQRNHLIARGFDRVSVVSRGIDSERFNPKHRCNFLRHSWGVEGDEPVILYVGRIAAEKNLGLVAAAYEEMRRKGLAPKFVLVGDGPLKPALAAKYPEMIFAGMKVGAELSKYYASADVFLFPSTTDTFGNVVIEAMASGLCVVAYDDAAAKQHLEDRRSGFIADLADEESFIQNVIEAYENEALRNNLATASSHIAQNLGWNNIVNALKSELAEEMSYQREVQHAVKKDYRLI